MVVIGGLVTVPEPGPGWVITFLGLCLGDGGFRTVAHFMDRVEVKLRAFVR